jgi:type IV pilus biogenesis protein PilP
MQNSKLMRAALLLAMTALCSGAACADPIASELLRLGEETTLLKAKAKRLEAQNQVSMMQKQLEQPGAGAVASAVASPAPPAVTTFVVQSIEGIGPVLYATILLDNGTTRDVKEGDVLNKNLRIVSIKPDELVYQQGKGGPTTVRVNPASKHMDLAALAAQSPEARSAAARPPMPPMLQPFQPVMPPLQPGAVPSRSAADPSRR